MPNIEILSQFLQNNFPKISKAESVFLEANIFVGIYENFSEMFRNQYKNYFKLIKDVQENDMIESNFLRLLVNDILSTNEYTLEGIANFVRMPVDAILEIVSGINTNPSLMLATRIIKLHGDVRRDFYNGLMKKIIEDTAGKENS